MPNDGRRDWLIMHLIRQVDMEEDDARRYMSIIRGKKQEYEP